MNNNLPSVKLFVKPVYLHSSANNMQQYHQLSCYWDKNNCVTPFKYKHTTGSEGSNENKQQTKKQTM